MFGGGSGGFGTSSTTFGTTPFGSSTSGQTSAFGTGATGFGSGTTSAFGAKPGFGGTTTSTFGSGTSAFGAKPFGTTPAPAPSAFGAAAAGTSAFGRTTSTSPFGSTPAPAPGAFGSSTTTSAFGAPAPASPFGAPAPAAGGLGAFGSSTTSTTNPFGKPAASPFGAASAPATGSVFGAPASGTGAFGGFGTSTATTSSGLFGSAPAPAATGAFGAPAPAPAPGTGLFGTPAPAPGLGSFGTGLGGTGAFGATAGQNTGTANPPWRETRAEDPGGKAGANPGMLTSISAMKEYENKSHEELRVEDYILGRKNSSAVTTTPTTTGFGGISIGGTPAPAPGLFGGFGTTPAPAPASGAFSFGSLNTPAPSPFGTGFGTSTTTGSSLGGGFVGFGTTPAPAPGGGLFGTTPAPAPSNNAFGAPAPAPSTGGFTFGPSAPTPAPASSFSFSATPAAAPSSGFFGSTTPAPAAGGFAFGAAPAPASAAGGAFGNSFAFGTPAPAPSISGFDFGGTSGSALGSTAGAPGAPAPAPTSMFGGTGGLFGTTPAPAPGAGGFGFGTGAKPPAPATGGFSFGPGSTSFGSAPKPASNAFAMPLSSGSMFGSTTTGASSGFNFAGAATAPAPAPQAGMFSFPAATASSGAPGFGSATPATAGGFAPTSGAGGSGLFGSGQQQPQPTQQKRVAVHNQDPYGSSRNLGFGSGALQQKVQGVQNSSQQLAISFERSSTPGASGASDANSSGAGAGSGMGLSIGSPSPSVGLSYRRTAISSARIRPRGLTSGTPGGGGARAGDGDKSMSQPSSARLLSEGSLTPVANSGVLSPDAYMNVGSKRLAVISTTAKEHRQRFSENRPLVRTGPLSSSGAGSAVLGAGVSPGKPTENGKGGAAITSNDDMYDTDDGGVEEKKERVVDELAPRDVSRASSSTPSRDGARALPSSTTTVTSPADSARRPLGTAGVVSPPPSGGHGTDVRAAAGGGDESLLEGSPEGTVGSSGAGAGAAGGTGSGGRLFDEDLSGGTIVPKLDIGGYETIPPMSELAVMSEDELRSVSGFVVNRPDVGKISWLLPVDIRGLDIGKLVAIDHKSASVYDNLPEGETKPAEGEGLNMPTRVTLLGVFPKTEKPSAEQKRGYEEKVRRNTERIGATLVSYSADTGIWEFATRHWSRYAMDDSDDEEEGEETKASDVGSGNGVGRVARTNTMLPSARAGDGTPSGVRSATANGAGLAPSSRDGQRSTRRTTVYAMPDTDDESSVADNVSDPGVNGARRSTEYTHGAQGDGVGDDDGDVGMADADVPPGAGRGVSSKGDDGWGDPRLRSRNLFQDDMDTEEVERIRLAFGKERDSIELRPGAQVFDTQGARGTEGGPQDAGSLRAPEPLVAATRLFEPLASPPARPTLADPEDAKAAAAYRPESDAAQSYVLRLLANAWTPQPGEVVDEVARGAVRAGQITLDLGLRLGRGFRASWGPAGRLVVCRGAAAQGRHPGGPRVQILQFDPTPAASGRGAEELYVETLRNHQRFARSTFETGGMAPRWTLPEVETFPDAYKTLVQCVHGYVKAHALAATASMPSGLVGTGSAVHRENSPDWVLEQAWRLVNAMWGQEEGEGTAQDLPAPGEEGRLPLSSVSGDGPGCAEDGASPSARREAAVAQWLADVVSPCVSSLAVGDGSHANGKEYPWRTVLELLSVRHIAEAAHVASSAGLPRLAVVLAAMAASTAQGGGWVGASYPTKALAMQSALWQAGGADARMPQEAFTVYQLLGREGFRDVRLKGVIGKGSESRYPSLDWLRQLGLCLWFGAGSPAGVSVGPCNVADALGAYRSLVKEKEALHPTARYFLESTHFDTKYLSSVGDELRRAYIDSVEVDLGSSSRSSGRDQCVLARLLELYGPRTLGSSATLAGAALLAAMEPLSVTPDVMDYRHSWHLMTVAEALGVARLQDRSTSAAVAESLRFQLEAAGLWEWAVYVALTTEGEPDRRDAVARELVVRYGHGLVDPPRGDEGYEDVLKRKNLLKSLGVPDAWLHEALAVRAGYEHNSALPSLAPPLVRETRKPSTSMEDGGAGPEMDTGEELDIAHLRVLKMRYLVGGGSLRLVRDAAREVCFLAPISMYLGGEHRYKVTSAFKEITRQLIIGDKELGFVDDGNCDGKTDGETKSSEVQGVACRGARSTSAMRISSGGRTKEFEAYRVILSSSHEGPEGSNAGWSKEERDRLWRMRRVVDSAAARVVGEAIAQEAILTYWREARLPAY